MSDTHTRNVAIIGAGPASLYAAQTLSKAGCNVVILNRDIKHGGLAEFGIYPNKYKMKNGLRKMFSRILAHPRVRYFGNVLVGDQADISLQEVRELGVDAIVVAVGAQGTKWLGLPGEEHEGVFHAKDLVYHYNGLPPFSEQDFPIGEDVCVIGLGNVCLDIVHWLSCEKKVRSVTAVARRGPAERAYTEKEMKIVSGALDTDFIREEIDRHEALYAEVDQDPEQLYQEIVQHADEPLEADSPTRFRIRFLRSPARIEANAQGRVTGLVCEHTKLTPDSKRGTRAVRLGEHETIPCDTVIFAIGDSIETSIGLPLEPQWGTTFATVPDVWEEHPDRPRYMVFNPEDETPIWDTFVVGWARKASDGLVGKARADAVQGCDEILAYLEGTFEAGPGDAREFDAILSDLTELLEERKVRFVRYEEVCRLIEAEESVAEERGLPEFKFTSTREMLELVSKDAAE